MGGKKRPSLLIQSSLSQSVKAAQITKTVIQLKWMRKKKQSGSLHPPHVCLLLLVPAQPPLKEEKNKTPPTLLHTFPQSHPDATVSFLCKLSGSLIKQWSPVYFQQHRLHMKKGKKTQSLRLQLLLLMVGTRKQSWAPSVPVTS